MFGDWNIEEFSQHFDEDVSQIGTASHERTYGKAELAAFYMKQREQLADLTTSLSRKPVYSKYIANDQTFLIEEDTYISIKETKKTFLMRITVVYEKRGNRWLVVQIHASTPDPEISDEEHLPVAGLQKKNEELEATVRERTRDLEIEAALERVRAQATGMLQSSDLLDIVVTMRKEFVGLGHEAHYFWHMKWCPDKYEKAMTSGDGSRIGMVMELPKHIHDDIPLIAEWEESSEPTLVYPMNINDAMSYVNKMILLGDFKLVDPNAPTNEDIRRIKGLTYVMARTSHGEIGYSLPGEVHDPPQEDVNVLSRFAGVFDLAYRRFEDLQKAEIRARESQIEAAVERVRAEAMAMHLPSDLVKVTQVLIAEISNLGIEGITGAAFILIDENDIVTMWDISDPGNMGFTRDYKSVYDPKEFKMLGEYWRKWKRGMEYFVIEYDLEKNKKVLEEWKVVDEENFKNLKRAIEQNKLKTQWNPFGSFSKGLLTLDMMKEPDRDTKNIVIKMAQTFDLAYQRFDDLQKAEQQAKAAKKQASLDRIRAEIASMRNQKDLELITPLIWSELVALQVPFFRCGVFIIDANVQKVQVYLSTPGGESIAAISFDFNSNQIVDDSVEYWRKQEVYRTKWSRDEFVSWSKNLLEQGLIPNVKSYQHDETPPDNLHLQFIPFRQGMLYVGCDHFLGEEHMNLIKDIADDFSIAYSRYEDFVKLEKAKYQTESAYGELKSTQSQLIHAEKMASLGELTAGIAHEIQNPLNFVNNFSDLNSELVEELKEAIEEGDTEEVNEILNDLKNNEQKIIHHGKRAEEIVKSMLQHSRGGDGKKELTNLNSLADEYLRLSYHGLRAKDKTFNADFKCLVDEQIPKINVVPQDIGRVILNLVNNAFHAVREKSQTGENGYSPAVHIITRKVDDLAEIIVKDNGSGIPDELIDKIFQPFFTTKATGSGTGLGLSLSFDIVTKGHGGTLEVKSKKGEGSEFIINLPIA